MLDDPSRARDAGMLVSVCVPDGVYEGQEFTVACDGREFLVVCPDNAGPGDEVELTVSPPPPPEPPDVVEVVVPDGLLSGDEFLVEAAGAAPFYCLVPEGCAGGSLIAVELPRPGGSCDGAPEAAAGLSPPLMRERRATVEDDSYRGARGDAAKLRPPPTQTPAGAFFLGQVGPHRPHGPPPPRAAPARLAPAPASPRPPRRPQTVDVFRSDGSWSRAYVEEYEERGETYTVRLADGRLKHFVERDELLAIKAGSFVLGRLVRYTDGDRWDCRGELAFVDDFDDGSGTYTLRREDGRLAFYVTEDEVR